MGRQEKKIGFLCLLLLVSGGWITFAARQGGESGLQGTDDRVHPSPVTPAPPSFLSDPDPASSPGITRDNGELFFKMLLSMGLVLGLGGAALYLSKHVLPRVARAPGKEIRILETTGLGPRKALHLVEVGGQRLLLASTSENVTMLTSLNETWLDMPRPELGEAVKI